MAKATITAATSAKVLVNASGVKSFPSAPLIVNTGKKLTTVVATEVSTAPATSRVASNTISRGESSGSASSMCLSTFSQIITPISTMVPMAMAMPESATMLADTPKSFIAIKHMSTATGSNALMRIELLRCMTIISTTIMVMNISSVSASLSVPKVSYIRLVRS